EPRGVEHRLPRTRGHTRRSRRQGWHRRSDLRGPVKRILMQLSEKLLQVARLGGPIVLWVLIALSVLSIGLMVERWWWFYRRRANLRQLGDDLYAALREGDLEHAKAVLVASPAPAAAIVAEALDWYGLGADAFREILDKGLRDRRKEIESGLLFLGTLGNNAPFIGLFGTVLGIVTAFRELGAATSG